MQTAPAAIARSLERAVPLDERELWSGPGIAVLIGALAACVGGILLVRTGGAALVWTAVALFRPRDLRLGRAHRHQARRGAGRPALRGLPGNRADDGLALGEPASPSADGSRCGSATRRPRR